jgi:hypothetical protein
MRLVGEVAMAVMALEVREPGMIRWMPVDSVLSQRTETVTGSEECVATQTP